MHMLPFLSRWRALLVSFCALALAHLLTAATQITHFDLRQDGAAALVAIDGPDGKLGFILIDTGRASSSGRGAALVRDELIKRGITRIDLAILTHLDADHAEGLFTLLGTTRVEVRSHGTAGEPIRGPPVAINRILLPADTLPQHERFRQDLVSAAKMAGAAVVSPSPEEIAKIEAEYAVTVLVPPSKPRAPNETSLVIVRHDRTNDTAFMFTGDIPAAMIQQMLPKLPKHVNVLQAPHHGADQGLLDLITRTNPDYIVISADMGNRYAHPRLSILRTLARSGQTPSPVWRLAAALHNVHADRFAKTLAREVESRVSRRN